MSIIINIDVMLAKRKMSVTELSERVGITMANISILKNGKAKAIKLSTLNSICKALNCQPGDILEYVEDEDKYYISFRDSVEQDCRIEIDKDIFDTYTNSKKAYIKIKNETSRHLEQSDLTEEDMYKRAFEPVESVEETVIKNIEKEKVNEALKDLTSTQFRRIDLHIVNEITIRDVAKLEKVQKSQIQKSLELGLKKIKKFFEE